MFFRYGGEDMIANQIITIGKYIVPAQDKIDILLNKQKEVKKKYLMICETSLNSNVECRLVEYDPKLKRNYLIGIVGSGGASYSPTMRMKSNEFKIDIELDEDTNMDNTFWSQFINTPEGMKFKSTFIERSLKIHRALLPIMNKDTYKDLPDSNIVRKFYSWLENNLSMVENTVFSFLSSHARYDKKRKKIKLGKDFPDILIFQIDNGNLNYPGNIPEFVDFYLALNEPVGDKGTKSNNYVRMGICQYCNSSSSNLNQPHIGNFTLDNVGFNMHFRHKDTSMYNICEDCTNLFDKGFNYIEKHLRFTAFKTENGVFDSKGVWINYYLIPNSSDPEILKRAIRSIEDTHKDINSRKKRNLEKQLIRIENATSKNREKNMKIKELKKKIESAESNKIISQTDLIKDLIKKMENNKVNLLNIYFYELDAKQNPTTKEIVQYFQIPGTQQQKLVDAMYNTKFVGSIYELKNIANTSLFFTMIYAIFSGQKIDVDRFLRGANKIIKEAFNKLLLGVSDLNYMGMQRRLEIFRKIYRLYQEAEIFR